MLDHTPTLETLDEMVPRVQRFSTALIARLRAAGLDVHTAHVPFLATSTHQIEIVSQINNLSVQMELAASTPAWADNPRARLQVSFDFGRRFFFYERAARKDGGFPMGRVLKLFLKAAIEQDQEALKTKEVLRKKKNAESRFFEFCEKLGLPATQDPHLTQTEDFGVRCLPASPGRVAITAIVSHSQAEEIIALIRKGSPPSTNSDKDF